MVSLPEEDPTVWEASKMSESQIVPNLHANWGKDPKPRSSLTSRQVFKYIWI